MRKDGQCAVSYVEYGSRCLILRPHNPGHPVDLIQIEIGSDFQDYVVGRVCQIMVEC